MARLKRFALLVLLFGGVAVGLIFGLVYVLGPYSTQTVVNVVICTWAFVGIPLAWKGSDPKKAPVSQ